MRLSALFLISICTLLAQTTSTSILGTVTDPSGAAISNAKVTLLQTATGVSRTDTTSSSGDFAFPLIDVGEYRVTVEAQGFKTQAKTNVQVQINEKVRVDFALQVGQISDRVEVTAEAATLRTDDVTVGNTVEQRRLVELPLGGFRNAANVAVLQPGVQFAPRGGLDGLSGSGGGIPIPGQTVAIIANGQRETNQHATLDGVVATEARVNTVPFAPSPEAMEEVRVLTGSYSAEYGFQSGAQLVMVMRSGTNQFHGSAHEFLQNDALNAEGYFQNYFVRPPQARFKKDGVRFNQFGGTFSGPVWIPKLYNGKNKTFFMVAYDGRRQRLPGAVQQALVPSEAMRTGDFSALLNRRNAAGAALPSVTIIDPVNGQPFAGNVIPTSRISTTARGLNSFWERPQQILPDPLTGFNYSGAGRQTIDDDQTYVKVDHNLGSKDRFMGRYATNLPNWLQVPGASPQFTYLVTGRNNNLATQWLHIFSPSIINEARYGYTTSRSDSFNPRANTDFSLSAIGLDAFRVVTDNNRPLTRREVGVPTMTLTGFQTLAELDGGNGFDDNRLHQINNNLSISAGKHNLKMGIDYRRVSLFRGAANVPRGSFVFAGDAANNSYAAFLLGVPSQTNTPEGLPLTDVRQNRWAGYFVDDWKATQRLTVNVGLRWEYNSAATDVRGLWRSLEWRNGLNSPPEFVPAQIRTTYQFYKPQRDMFMPRIGLSYRLQENWVIRAGYGIYYNLHQLNNYTILNLNPPLSGSSNFANSVTNGALAAGTTVYSFASPFGALNPRSTVNANVLNTQNLQPQVNQWSFDIQRRFPGQVVLTVGYIGSKTSHMDNTVELNNPDPAFNTPASNNPQLRRPFQNVLDNGVLRPLSRLRWLDSGANAWYQGLQVNLQKRMSRGLTFTFAYTYSKTLFEGYGRNEGDGFNPNVYQNPRNRAGDKGRVGWDARQNAVANFVYDVPSLFKSGLGKVVFGGWQANAIVTMRTGFPFSVQQGNIINTFNSAVRPDRIGSGKAANPTVDQWYNPDDFRIVSCANTAVPETCKYGSSGVGILEGPGFNNWDSSLFKNFTIRERFKIQFRSEFLNTWNTPQFGRPNPTLNTGGGFLPTRTGSGLSFPSQANIVRGPGAITSTVAPMRRIQFGLKLQF
jgi:hypothetical protein